jgi:hypothetical protein
MTLQFDGVILFELPFPCEPIDSDFTPDVREPDAAHGDACDCFKTSVLTMSSLRSMVQSYGAPKSSHRTVRFRGDRAG